MGANAVAIISILSTAVVAIIIPFISARLERQRLRFQATQERFAELRTLLDQACQRLTEGQTVLARLIAERLDKSSHEERPEERITELAVEVFQDNTRLALRLGGGHSLHQAHTEAMSVLLRVEAQCRTQQGNGTMDDLTAFGKGLAAFMRGSLDILHVPAPQVVRGELGSTV